MANSIVFYTKPGCHLCEETRAMLNALRAEFQFTLKEIDIERDPGLLKQYFDQIPVLVINHRTTLAAPIRMQDVRAAFLTAQGSERAEEQR